MVSSAFEIATRHFVLGADQLRTMHNFSSCCGDAAALYSPLPASDRCMNEDISRSAPNRGRYCLCICAACHAMALVQRQLLQSAASDLNAKAMATPVRSVCRGPCGMRRAAARRQHNAGARRSGASRPRRSTAGRYTPGFRERISGTHRGALCASLLAARCVTAG